MQRRLSPASGSLLLLLIFSLVPAPPASAQVRLAPEATPTPLVQVLEQGRRLEAEDRWGEALTYYKDALREHPHQQTLVERADLAKMHYDLGRRYADPSFRESIFQLDGQRALALYSEVLLKLNAHYVAAPQWREIVARGTTRLDLALGEEVFRAAHLQSVTQDQIDAFRSELRERMGTLPIRSRREARDAAAAACQLAERRLGLRPAVVAMEYTCAATGGLDHYSTYLTADQLRDIYSQIEGNFVGLGIELKGDEGALLLVHIIPDSPAERAGLKAGDRITAVDGRATKELSTDAAASRLQGPEGSTVRITVVTPGQPPRQMSVRREHVEVPSVEDVRIIDRDYGIGYLRLTSFQKTTTRDLDAALWKLHREGMRSLVMDLRGNPGGLLTTSVEVADRFLEQGTIVSTRGRSPQEDYTYTAHGPGTWGVPLVVLIDGDSASASEIFAGAIHDNHRGTIVGAQSYGKGSVQGIFPLDYAGAGLRLTTAKFYSPSGRAIAGAGVHPDVVVRSAAKPADRVLSVKHGEDDVALDAALNVARRQVASR
jgi:carboxyl-terminal processing protease